MPTTKTSRFPPGPTRSPALVIIVASTLIFLFAAALAAIDRLIYGFRASRHIFFLLFARQELGAGALGAVILALGYVASRRWSLHVWIERLMRQVSIRPALTSGVVAAALAAGALSVYHAYPLSMDEYTPVFQSEIFATGKAFGRYPPPLVPRLIDHRFLGYFFLVRPETGEVASRYWPGHALLLTPFTWLGVSWLLNPLLGAAAILLLRHLARELIGEQGGAWAAVLALASPVFWAYAISYYSMTAHLVVNLAFSCFMLKGKREGFFWAGFVGSWGLALHQPIFHPLFAAPWVAFLVFRRQLRSLGYLILGYLPLGLLLGVGWAILRTNVTTEWREFLALQGLLRQAGPFSSTSEIPLIRFVIGSLNIFVDRSGMGWESELRSQLKMWVWCLPGLPLLAGIGAWISRRRGPLIWLPACSFLITFTFFFFVQIGQGHGWGYRYLHAVWWVMPFYGAACLVHGPFADLRRTYGAIVLGTLLVFLPFRMLQIGSFVEEVLSQRAFPGLEGPAVVFVQVNEGFYRQDLVRNDPFLRGDVLTMVATDPLNDEKLARALLAPPLRRLRSGNDTAWLGKRLNLPQLAAP